MCKQIDFSIIDLFVDFLNSKLHQNPKIPWLLPLINMSCNVWTGVCTTYLLIYLQLW